MQRKLKQIKTSTQWRTWSASIMACMLLAACTNTDVSDLESFVEETRRSQKGRIDPLPQFKPFGTYEYSAGDYRDPFSPWEDINEAANERRGVSKGPQPDFDRRKELLENFPLDSLRMVGTLAQADGSWAIVKAPDGMVYRVREGNFLGQNHGKVLQLREEKIELRELVPDGLGGWQERSAFLTLVD